MERYLLQNQATLVLGDKNCSQTDSESDIISPWDEKKPWNNQKSKYFKSLLRGTRLVEDDTEEDEAGLDEAEFQPPPIAYYPSLNAKDEANLPQNKAMTPTHSPPRQGRLQPGGLDSGRAALNAEDSPLETLEDKEDRN